MRHAIVSCFITALTLLLFSGGGHFAAARAGNIIGPAGQPAHDLLVQPAGGCSPYARPCREPERPHWRPCRDRYGQYCGNRWRDDAEYRCGDGHYRDGWSCDAGTPPPECGLLCWMRRARDGYCGHGCDYYLHRRHYSYRYYDGDY
jgi:hypothetical protein